jgi:hypothetical protein
MVPELSGPAERDRQRRILASDHGEDVVQSKAHCAISISIVRDDNYLCGAQHFRPQYDSSETN